MLHLDDRATIDRHAEERAWLLRIRAGDAAAFELLFRRYAEALYDFVHGYVGSRDVAEEVVQQLFVRVWERRHVWEVQDSVASYLYRAARNGAHNAVRDHHRAHLFRAKLARTEEATPARTDDATASDRALLTSELATAVDRAVRRLPERCREVFRLNRYHHLTYPEVAQVLGLSVKTVEAHMARAFRELRSRLQDWRP
ncbi:MAG TPA: RNA polymerase sigma-70 factor [Gemmatimonadaceae bacterium]|jgi:RNA polymerase sigma-70 factor (ECF subfamily)|nr:RNA polymerase sigma-70 factor [Gemmatimonadaceae bacterium]